MTAQVGCCFPRPVRDVLDSLDRVIALRAQEAAIRVGPVAVIHCKALAFPVEVDCAFGLSANRASPPVLAVHRLVVRDSDSEFSLEIVVADDSKT